MCAPTCAADYGVKNSVSIRCGGFADGGFGGRQDRDVPLQVINRILAGIALLSDALALLIRPREGLVRA